jgi:hypothetical protein
MLQDFRHGQHGHHMAVRVPNFDAGFTERGAVIHELPHQIACAVFGFRQRVFEVHEFCAFLVARHTAFIAEIDEITRHFQVLLANHLQRFRNWVGSDAFFIVQWGFHGQPTGFLAPFQMPKVPIHYTWIRFRFPLKLRTRSNSRPD